MVVNDDVKSTWPQYCAHGAEYAVFVVCSIKWHPDTSGGREDVSDVPE